MHHGRDKILKKDEDKTELDELVAKVLTDYEMQLKPDSTVRLKLAFYQQRTLVFATWWA